MKNRKQKYSQIKKVIPTTQHVDGLLMVTEKKNRKFNKKSANSYQPNKNHLQYQQKHSNQIIFIQKISKIFHSVTEEKYCFTKQIKKLRPARQISRVLLDRREKCKVKHKLEAIISQQIHTVTLGYEDLNDHENLRKDILFHSLLGRDKEKWHHPQRFIVFKIV